MAEGSFDPPWKSHADPGNGMALRIEGTGLTSSGYTVSLNGQEVRGLRALTLYMGSADVNEVTLSITVTEVEISQEALRTLEGYVEKGRDDEAGT